MQRGNGSFRGFRRIHRDKGESAGAAAHFVHDKIHRSHGAMRTKGVLQIVLSRVEGKISYIQFRAHF